MQVLLANPRGFCAGVDRAIDIVERALELFGAPIYVRHEVVHNRYVVDRLRDRGAIFVEELSEVPPGATVIFSAHGVSNAVVEEARVRGLTVFDACPSQEVYASFTASDMFREAIAAAGLPAPRTEGLGGVQVAHLSREVRP